jgi:transposase
MAKKKTSKKVRRLLEQQVHPQAAGIDVSASEMMVAVSPSAPEPVRCFGTMTRDLKAICQHLKAHHIITVAMESTALYWVPLYEVLEEAGIEVCLVNARHVKNVPGRKTDVCDAQWLQQLHTAGLLRGGFRPPAAIRRLRDLMRERGDYIEQSSHQILMMQRCFDQMNVQLHRVVSDLDGESGRRIIEAILAGQRDPEALEKLRNWRCKTPKAEVIKALEGQWDEDCIERLSRAYGMLQAIDKHLVKIATRMEALVIEMQTPVKEFSPKTEKGAEGPEAEAATGRTVYLRRKAMGKNAPMQSLREEAHRLFGVDLMEVPGVSHATIAVLLSEVGTAGELRGNFPCVKRFTSWLGLCPDNNISGGKVLGSKTRHVTHRLAAAFRLSAFGLGRSNSVLGEFCRRMKSRLGKAEGITATAHKIARILYTMITTGSAYDEKIAGQTSPASIARKVHNLKNRAAALGFTLVATG